LFRLRLPRTKYGRAQDNFKALLGVFLKQLKAEEDLRDIFAYEPLIGQVCIYDLFHAALTWKTAAGEVDWNRVALEVGRKWPNGEGRGLKRAYCSLLIRFQKLTRDTCPAKVLLIDQELSIVIYKTLKPKPVKTALSAKPGASFEEPIRKRHKLSDTRVQANRLNCTPRRPSKTSAYPSLLLRSRHRRLFLTSFQPSTSL
jgi:hypothetical protein